MPTISEQSQSVPSRSSSQPPNPASTPTPSKRSRINKEKDCDAALLECLSGIESRRQERAKEKEMDPDTHFAMDIAARLKKLPPRDKAIAKIKLLEVLTAIEFPTEQYPHTSNYTAQNYYGSQFN